MKVMNWVWEQSPVKGNERLLLLAIADCAADDGTNAYPSKQKLAEKTLMDQSTVRRLVRRLENNGFLVVDRSDQRGRANVYAVVMRPSDQAVEHPAEAVDCDVDNVAKVGVGRPRGNVPPRHSGPEGGHTGRQVGVQRLPNHQEPSMNPWLGRTRRRRPPLWTMRLSIRCLRPC